MTPGLAVVVLGAGAVGALLRYLAGLAVARTRPGPPWTVLAVNVAGSFIAGLAIGLSESGVIADDLRLVLVTGFAGGLTTFSTLSVETIQLAMTRRWRSAVANVTANLVLGVGAAVAGWAIGSAI
jgi:CrcB protein